MENSTVNVRQDFEFEYASGYYWRFMFKINIEL